MATWQRERVVLRQSWGTQPVEPDVLVEMVDVSWVNRRECGCVLLEGAVAGVDPPRYVTHARACKEHRAETVRAHTRFADTIAALAQVPIGIEVRIPVPADELVTHILWARLMDEEIGEEVTAA